MFTCHMINNSDTANATAKDKISQRNYKSLYNCWGLETEYMDIQKNIQHCMDLILWQLFDVWVKDFKEKL